MRESEFRMDMALKGVWGLARRDRETGEVEVLGEVENTITTDGLYDFLDLMIGASTSTYGDGEAQIDVWSGTDGTGTNHFTSTTQAATEIASEGIYPPYPKLEGVDGSYGQVICWCWEDISVNEYTPGSVTMKRSGATFNFSLADVSATGLNWGSKTDRYNWIFFYRLKFGGSVSRFGDGASWYDGFSWPASLFIGEDEYNSSPVSAFSNNSTTGVKMKITDQTTPTPNTATLSVSSGPTRTGASVEWEFVAADGIAEFEWYHRELLCGGSAGETFRKQSDTAHGTKGSNQEWTFTYTLTVSTS